MDTQKVTDLSFSSSSRCVGRVICDCVSVSVCVRAPKRKTAWAINTRPGRHTVHGSRSACIDAEIKRSKVKITRLSNALPSGYAVDVWFEFYEQTGCSQLPSQTDLANCMSTLILSGGLYLETSFHGTSVDHNKCCKPSSTTPVDSLLRVGTEREPLCGMNAARRADLSASAISWASC